MIKNDLIMLIKKLDEESTIEEIKEILLYDFKNESPNDRVRIEDNSIKKFLLYKIDYKRSKFDCDTSDLALELLKNSEKEKYEDLDYQWYCNNINKFFLDYYFHNYNVNKTLWEMDNNLLFTNHSFTHKKPRSIEEFTECLRNINARIIRRGTRLIKNLNLKLDNETLENVCSQILL